MTRRSAFSGKPKQSVVAVLLLVACGGVSNHDATNRYIEPGGSGAQSGSGSGADGSGATNSGSVGSGPIPGTGGYGNTAGVGGVSSGGFGSSGGDSSENCNACFPNPAVYNDCIFDAACYACITSFTSNCADNALFREFDASVCNSCRFCFACHFGPGGVGGEAGYGGEAGNDGYGGEPGSAGYGGDLIAAGAPGE